MIKYLKDWQQLDHEKVAASAIPQLNHLQAQLKQKLNEQEFKSDTTEIIDQSVLNQP